MLKPIGNSGVIAMHGFGFRRVDLYIKGLNVVGVIALSACGGTPQYPVAVKPEVSFVATDTTVSFTNAQGGTTTVPRESKYDYGTFAGGLVASGDQRGMIATSQNDEATASIVVHDVNGALAVVTYYERVTAIDRPLTGDAVMNGAYISTFRDADLGVTQVRGDAVFTVDFGESTIEGEVRNRTAYLSGIPFEFVLDDASGDIDFMQTRIDRAGAFTGEAVFVNTPTSGQKWTYTGLIAGAGGSQVVGAVTMAGETGVFAAAVD